MLTARKIEKKKELKVTDDSSLVWKKKERGHKAEHLEIQQCPSQLRGWKLDFYTIKWYIGAILTKIICSNIDELFFPRARGICFYVNKHHSFDGATRFQLYSFTRSWAESERWIEPTHDCYLRVIKWVGVPHAIISYSASRFVFLAMSDCLYSSPLSTPQRSSLIGHMITHAENW